MADLAPNQTEGSLTQEGVQAETEFTTLEVENPLSVEDMLQGEEVEDEEMIEIAVAALRTEELPPLPLIPPPSPPPPPPSETREGGMSPQARAEEPRTEETPEPDTWAEKAGT